MNTRILLIASAVFTGAIGLALTFAPDEIATVRQGSYTNDLRIALQLCGALYCGFALTAWMAKGAALGGIYGRPIVIGNLTFYTIAALALAKTCMASPSMDPMLLALAVVHASFALLFGYTMYTHPAQRT